MKLLILMMSCNKDHFVKQSQISKESLRRQIEHHKLENEIVVYDYVGDAESNHIDDSTIYLKTNDDMDHTFDKTYDCLQFINSQNIEYKEPRHEVKLAVPTYQKSIDILGFEHKTNLREGLENMWKWAKKQPKRPQYKWDNYEVTKKLYSYWK